jgi:uncharacterized protein with ATP-grasp and redox domains
MPDRPAMIRTDGSNAFAYNTMKVRVPAIIREVAVLNPDYPVSIQTTLAQLASNIESDQPIPLIDMFSPDFEQWALSYAPYAGDTWLNTDWFFAEIYCYRLLIQVVRWWETGRDPFTPKKFAELGSPELWERIEEVVSSADQPFEERLLALVYAALWSNRMDLSFAASQSHGTKNADDDLLVDDSVAVVRHLLDHNGDIHMIIDNTGTELAMDLALADGLLQRAGNRIIIHPKMHPTFVSDATASDILTLIEKIRSQTGAAVRHFGDRLHQAFETGRLRFAPDFYWNSTRLLWDMPLHLVNAFQTASLVIIKGDANYRRMVGDILWPPETPFATVTDYFPAPLLALRTLKSDLVVGLPSGLVEHLDSTDPHWRTNGRRGLIHFRAVP